MGRIHEFGVPGWAARGEVPRIKLQLVPDAAPSPMLSKRAAGDTSPFISGKGDGGVDLVCGRCEHQLADHLYPANKIAGMVLCCPICGAYNLA